MTGAAAAVMTRRGIGISDSAYDTLLKTTMSGTLLYIKGPKNGSLIEEEIANNDLTIVNDYFENEAASLPNGDTALLVRGDLSATHKATRAVPTLSPDIFNVGDVTLNNDWAMTAWVKFPQFSGGTYDQHLFGATVPGMAAWVNNTRNPGAPLLMMVQGLGGFRFFRDPLNNNANASPNSAHVLQTTLTEAAWTDRWVLVTINVSAPVANLITVSTYYDSFENSLGTDTADGTGASGSYTSGRLLHIGAVRTLGTGWPGQWRMAKWAFHDHQLTQAERRAMVQAMHGTSRSFSDNFNRADGGIADSNWVIILSNSVVIASNQVTRSSSPTTAAAIGWYADHGTPEIYAQCSVVQNGEVVQPMVRVMGYNVIATITGAYRGGWNDVLGRWEVMRGTSTLVGSSAGGGPSSYPYTCRVEARTVSGNAEIKVFANGVLKLTATDSGGSKNLVDQATGVYLKGKTGENAIFDDFASGTL